MIKTPSADQKPKGSQLLLSITALIVIWALVANVQTAFQYSVTYDEPFHRDWNNRLYDEQVSERESVYNYISTTPILQLNIAVARILTDYYPELPVIFLQRLPGALWLSFLFLGVFLLAKRVSNQNDVGLLAVLFVALEPSIIAHSALLTVDLPFATILVWLLFSFFSYLDALSFVWAAIIGLLIGLAFITKFTAVFILPFLVIGTFVFSYRRFSLLTSMYRMSLAVLIAGVVALTIINCAYYWTGFGTLLKDYSFFNPSFRQLQASFASIFIPLPYDFVSGFDHLSMAGKRDEWNNILFEQWNGQGVWYYYLALFFYKTPLSLIACTIGGLLLLAHHATCSISAKRGEAVAIFLFALALFLHFSLFVKVQVGYRYVLMTLPLFFIAAAYGLKQSILSSRVFDSVILVMVILAAAELIPFHSNRLSFSNTLIPEKETAYKVLADSNIDWGQNRNTRSEWQQKYGLRDVPLNPYHLLPGNNIFPVNHLLGVFWNFEQHKWIRSNLHPIRHFFHTDLLYYASTSDFRRFLSEERSLKPLPEGAPELARGSRRILSRALPYSLEAKGKPQFLLFKTIGEQMIRFANKQGSFELGVRKGKGHCEYSRIGYTQEAWYFLSEAGEYYFCLRPTEKFSLVHVSSPDV